MGIEIERKFLVDPRRWDLTFMLSDEVKYFRQGYLSTDPAVRLRISAQKGVVTDAFLTTKGPGTRSRSEFEYSIPTEDAEDMWALVKHAIYKRRLVYGRWEIDKFEGALEGLWLAEIELESEDETFEMPSWVLEEVTHDARYSNANLAKYGLPLRCI
jgi:adenylate cyclase